jgi:hypothetical protein
LLICFNVLCHPEEMFRVIFLLNFLQILTILPLECPTLA